MYVGRAVRSRLVSVLGHVCRLCSGRRISIQSMLWLWQRRYCGGVAVYVCMSHAAMWIHVVWETRHDML